jgi:predicted KAP-like P-loop ATPase
MPIHVGAKPSLCPTRLIVDAAVGDDAFQHKAIAAAIAEMIERDLGGCAIALTGAWGSGKSTVVKLLEQKLRCDPPVAETFVFDAWSH